MPRRVASFLSSLVYYCNSQKESSSAQVLCAYKRRNNEINNCPFILLCLFTFLSLLHASPRFCPDDLGSRSLYQLRVRTRGRGSGFKVALGFDRGRGRCPAVVEHVPTASVVAFLKSSPRRFLAWLRRDKGFPLRCAPLLGPTNSTKPAPPADPSRTPSSSSSSR